jgi:hypothetical protein
MLTDCGAQVTESVTRRAMRMTKHVTPSGRIRCECKQFENLRVATWSCSTVRRPEMVGINGMIRPLKLAWISL